MTDIVRADEELFSDESYQKYLSKMTQIKNVRQRWENETIFDALLAPEADFTKAPYGDEIIAAMEI